MISSGSVGGHRARARPRRLSEYSPVEDGYMSTKKTRPASADTDRAKIATRWNEQRGEYAAANGRGQAGIGALGFAQLFEVKDGKVREGHLDPYEGLEDMRPVPFLDGWRFGEVGLIWSSDPFPDQSSAKAAALAYEAPTYLKEGAAMYLDPEKEPFDPFLFWDAVMDVAHYAIWLQHTGKIDPALAEEIVSFLHQTRDIVVERLPTVRSNAGQMTD
jgi:hypothetical protein